MKESLEAEVAIEPKQVLYQTSRKFPMSAANCRRVVTRLPILGPDPFDSV